MAVDISDDSDDIAALVLAWLRVRKLVGWRRSNSRGAIAEVE
jgi:hypothetical protein